MRNFKSAISLGGLIISALITFTQNQIISPGILLEKFANCQSFTGIFPDVKNHSSRLMLVNQGTCQCVHLNKAGNGVPVETQDCYNTTNDDSEVDSQLFWISRIGSGYIIIASKLSYCIGATLRSHLPLYSGDWCNYASHQFYIRDYISEAYEEYLQILNKESNLCLTSSSNLLYVSSCDTANPYQKWRLCNLGRTRCYPSENYCEPSN